MKEEAAASKEAASSITALTLLTCESSLHTHTHTHTHSHLAALTHSLLPATPLPLPSPASPTLFPHLPSPPHPSPAPTPLPSPALPPPSFPCSLRHSTACTKEEGAAPRGRELAPRRREQLTQPAGAWIEWSALGDLPPTVIPVFTTLNPARIHPQLESGVGGLGYAP